MSEKLKIDFNQLSQKTIEYITKNNLQDLSLNEPSNQRNSCWAKITESVYGKFDPLNSLNIWNQWKKNTKNYRTIVKNCLKKIDLPVKSKIDVSYPA
jgi:hypothetical protein